VIAGLRKANDLPNVDLTTQRLAEYWFRARLMHDLLHTLMEIYDGDLNALDNDGHMWEFMTYLDYWLSALFVVVEGFNKLKLKDARVQRLFNSHVSQLKQLRHQTYHFIVQRKAPEVIKQLNWAEELHVAIDAHILDLIRSEKIKEEAQKFIKWRAAKKQ
jgi:hypothetical protein